MWAHIRTIRCAWPEKTWTWKLTASPDKHPLWSSLSIGGAQEAPDVKRSGPERRDPRTHFFRLCSTSTAISLGPIAGQRDDWLPEGHEGYHQASCSTTVAHSDRCSSFNANRHQHTHDFTAMTPQIMMASVRG